MHPLRSQQGPAPAGQGWQDSASCRGPNHAIFYPPSRLERRSEKKRREDRAKEICAQCPVIVQCRSYAIEIGEQHGIWGGLTAKERRDLATAGSS